MTEDALERAQGAGLDLVEVNNRADPPVCKILDYGRWRYEQKKTKKAREKGARDNTPSEIKMRPATEEHDFQHKIRKAVELIKKGSKVKLTIRYRRGELRRKEVGEDLLDRAIEALSKDGRLDGRPSFQGNTLSCVVVPKA